MEPDVTVLSRLRPLYDPVNIRLGTVLIQPSLSESVGYESNVLGSTIPQGGPVIETTGSVAAVSTQSRAAVNASASVDDIRYPNQDLQSHTDFTVSLGGSYQFGRDVASAQYIHQNLNQTVQSLDVAQALNQALAYRIDDGRLAYRASLARTFVVPAIEVTSYNYDNGTAGNAVYLQNYRNRVVVQPSVTVGYELAPRRNVVAVVRDGIGTYSVPLAGNGTRNYNDLTLLGGLDYDLSGALRFRALAGYEQRVFQSGQFATITAPVLEFAVIWNPTGLTTVTANASRHINDSSDQSTGATTETSARIQVDHELRRNILLQASGGLIMDQYTGSTSQILYSAGVKGTYLANRQVNLTVSYDYLNRQSSSSGNVNLGGANLIFGPNYDDHPVLLQVRLRL